MNDIDIYNALESEYTDWLTANNLPDVDAESLLLMDNITSAQRTWLSDFVRRWESV